MNIRRFMKTGLSVTSGVIRVCVNASARESSKYLMILMTERNTSEEFLEG